MDIFSTNGPIPNFTTKSINTTTIKGIKQTAINSYKKLIFPFFIMFNYSRKINFCQTKSKSAVRIQCVCSILKKNVDRKDFLCYIYKHKTGS
ncbi:MAG: hypothetical protein B5M53_09935 [Candidatus Cloacimonas sp. 4484_209]|nr:MAG: hypothetical protein B5M53_09935 [Candidatus Cloacimonas sp. 4484_209]